MDTKFSFLTIDNLDLDREVGENSNLKLLAHLVFQKYDEDQESIYIGYEYHPFTCEDDDYNPKCDSLGSLSIEEAKELIRALQFMTEGK